MRLHLTSCRPLRAQTIARALVVIVTVVIAGAAGTAGAGIAPPAPVAHNFQLGEQAFASGTTPVYDWKILHAGANDPAPFNRMFGDDRSGKLGAFQYTHSFSLGGGLTARSATLTIGLIDIDSPIGSKKPTIKVFFNGVLQPTSLFTGISSLTSRSSVDVVTVPVSLDLLKTGSLTVKVKAIRHAPHFAGNAIGADFSRLTIFTDPLTDPSGNPSGPEGPGDPTGPTGPTGPGGGGNGNGGGGGGGGGGNDGPPTLVPLPPAGPAASIVLLALVGCRLLRKRLRRGAY